MSETPTNEGMAETPEAIEAEGGGEEGEASGEGPGPAPDDPFTARIEALWQEHRGEILARLDAIDEAVIAVTEDRLEPEVRSEAAAAAHKLVGTLGTYGVVRGSELAREAEALLEGDAPLSTEDILTLSEVVVRLREAVEERGVGAEIAPAATLPSQAARATVVILGSTPERAYRHVAEGREMGLRVEVHSGTNVRSTDESAALPGAVIYDLGGRDGIEGLRAAVRSFEREGMRAPVVAIGATDTLDERLTVVRLGVERYLGSETPAALVMRTVDDLLAKPRPAGSRVLVVDDDEATLAIMRSLLERRHIEVETLADATRFVEVVEEFSPHLVVMDVMMPKVGGLELCKVMRADRRWSGIPVLFLTGKTDASLISELFAAGADDYVPKPVVGPVLVSRIQSRLERIRLAGEVAERDPLTGLPNRRRTYESLAALFREAGEEGAFAVVRVDRLGTINQRYGVAVGDLVMRRTAEILSQHLDEGTLVGRLDGAEFAVGRAPGSAGELTDLLEEARERLGSASLPVGEGESIRPTFSGVVAAYPSGGRDLEALHLRIAREFKSRVGEGSAARIVPLEGPDVVAAQETTDVLIVEDDEAVGELLVDTMELRGLSVRWIGSGDEALRLLLGNPPPLRPRVVLLDVGLPGADGLSVLRRLYLDGVAEEVPVIMLTSRTAEREVLTALEFGAFDHIGKPFSVPVLMHRIDRALEE